MLMREFIPPSARKVDPPDCYSFFIEFVAE